MLLEKQFKRVYVHYAGAYLGKGVVSPINLALAVRVAIELNEGELALVLLKDFTTFSKKNCFVIRLEATNGHRGAILILFKTIRHWSIFKL
jgi:hypothetical protein